MPNPVMGLWILRFNGQDHLVRSRNYCCSSITLVSREENKTHSHRKITLKHTQTTGRNRITFRTGKKGVRAAEVGDLVSVSEKSATELKLEQKLLKCKLSIQIVTFNVRTLNRIGQLPELSASGQNHNRYNKIQEQRYTHREDINYHDSGNG